MRSPWGELSEDDRQRFKALADETRCGIVVCMRGCLCFKACSCEFVAPGIWAGCAHKKTCASNVQVEVTLCRQYMAAAGPLPASATPGEAVAKVLAQIACGASEIVDDELQPVGLGLYPLVSLLRHSDRCASHAVWAQHA